MERRIYDNNIFSENKLKKDINEVWMILGMIKYNLQQELFYEGINVTKLSKELSIIQKELYSEIDELFKKDNFPKTQQEYKENFYVKDEKEILFSENLKLFFSKCKNFNDVCIKFSTLEQENYLKKELDEIKSIKNNYLSKELSEIKLDIKN